MIRFDDDARTVALSVRDLVESGPPRGDLTLSVVQRSRTRLAAGQQAHTHWQAQREAAVAGFRREVTLRTQWFSGDWAIKLMGRVDGLTESLGRWTVEELKSTALDAARLHRTTAEDWTAYVEQLEIYVWLVQLEHPGSRVEGELVFVSLADQSRHVIQVRVEAEVVAEWVERRVAAVIEAHEDRLAWMSVRSRLTTQWPFPTAREGQDRVRESVGAALVDGVPLLVEAPTGLGKTAAVLTAAVEFALATGRQVFWATTRTTQQPVVDRTLEALADAGTPLRAVFLNARRKVCLNRVDGEIRIDCRGESCRFAEGYFDKLRETSLLRTIRDGRATRDRLEHVALTHEVCPYQVARDLAPQVDVVVGDTNYVFDPSSRIGAFFADAPDGWVVVADEVHQLVERARGYRSPNVSARRAAEAVRFLEDLGPAFRPFAFLARQVEDRIVEAQAQVVGPTRGRKGVAELSEAGWEDLADRIDEVGLDYALLKADTVRTSLGEDPWLDLARSVLRFQQILAEIDAESVVIVDATPRHESIAVCCLDASAWLGPQIRGLGGFIGASATVSPAEFYRDLLGLGPDARHLSIPSPFPPERQAVVIAPRVSTAFKDRLAHASATAALIAECVDATPGNAVIFFPSFAMLESLVPRLDLQRHSVLAQARSLSEVERVSWLDSLTDGTGPHLLAAVLGGIFAEGIDLPAGALDTVLICGPGYPPVGLERTLLQEHYDTRYDAGFFYASVVPGITRVVQAAGRLIRRPEDRGAVVLLGRRFRFREVTALLPERWEPHVASDPAQRVSEFFAKLDGEGPSGAIL